MCAMTTRPAVSVLIAAYRSQATIARAVRSVLAQSFQDWEVVIACDDGADYLTFLAAEGIADPRLRQVPTQRFGSGCANARNAALAAAAGDFVTPLDADDLFAPGRLAALMPLAARAGAVVDNLAAVEDGSGRLLSHFLPPADAPARLDALRFFQTWVPAKPLTARKLAPQWDPDCGLCDDVVYLCRLFDRLGPLAFCARPLQDYRVVEGSVCHSADSAAVAEASYNRILTRLDDRSLNLHDSRLRRIVRRGIEAKRDFNRAYGTAVARGFTGTFQHFAAAQALQPAAVA